MTPTLRAPVLVPGVATGIGSLPHDDPVAAAEVVLRCLPELPAAPQLPARDPREGMLAQWLGALPEVERRARRLARGRRHDSDAAPDCDFDDGGARRAPRLPRRRRGRASKRPVRVKVQVTGPLTLGVALHAAGMPAPRAFRRAAEVTRAWSVAVEELVARACPTPGSCCSSTSPRSCRGSRGDAPLDRESAIDVLSGALAAVDCVTGVHVCGDGDLGLALEAGPEVLGVEVSDDLVQRHGLARALPRRRRLDRVGRGADRPTGRRIGRPALAHARARCGASSRGAGAIRCRCAHAGLITPACGLAGYGASQAERVLGIARELAARVHDQAVAARLTLGA